MRAKQQINKQNLNTTRLESIAILPTKETVDEAQQAKQNALMSCISTLEDLDKSIVILSLDGLKYKAIAEITGLTENHVAVKMKRIKQQLKTCITSKL
jgi:RNA polymerase sigma-70 factor (ECF subfamily)